MGFGKEMEELVSAFKVGASISSDKRQRAAAEAESIRNNETANTKLKQQGEQFDRTYSLNQSKLTQAQQQHADKLGMTQKQIDAANARAAEAMNRFNETQKLERDKMSATQRAKAEEAAVAKKKAVLDNPLADEDANDAAEAKASERWPEQALPIDDGGGNPADRPGEPGAPPNVAPVLDAGLRYLQDSVVNGSAVGGAQALASGQGARTPEELALLNKLVDPYGELDDRSRNLMVMTDSYERLIKAGKPEEAAQMAASIIQSARVAAAVHGGAALVKMEDQDTDGAIDALQKAMDAIPDGRSVILDKESMTFQYVDDATGEVTAEGQITPESILALATGMKDGSAFWSTLMQAAKGDENSAKLAGVDTPKGTAKGAKSDEYFVGKASEVKPEDYTAAEETFLPQEGSTDTPISTALKDFIRVPAADGTKSRHPMLDASTAEEIAGYMGEDNYTSLQELATYIKVHNSMSTERAAAVALELATPLDDPQAWNFKMPRRAATTGWAELQSRKSGMQVIVPEGRAMSALVKARTGLDTMQKKLEELDRTAAQEKAADEAAIQKGEDFRTNNPPPAIPNDAVMP
jgi:hypothetical protein